MLLNYLECYLGMKILLLSDNHGYIDEGILQHVDWADEVWHAGDWLNLDMHQAILKRNKTLRGVHGNIDGTDVKNYHPLINHFEIEGVKVFMTHIGGKPGKYNAKILGKAAYFKPKLFICGHSHILQVKNDPIFGWMYLNPGACGLHGFHQVRTALRFQINQGAVSNMEIIEWKRHNSIPIG